MTWFKPLNGLAAKTLMRGKNRFLAKNGRWPKRQQPVAASKAWLPSWDCFRCPAGERRPAPHRELVTSIVQFALFGTNEKMTVQFFIFIQFANCGLFCDGMVIGHKANDGRRRNASVPTSTKVDDEDIGGMRVNDAVLTDTNTDKVEVGGKRLDEAALDDFDKDKADVGGTRVNDAVLADANTDNVEVGDKCLDDAALVGFDSDKVDTGDMIMNDVVFANANMDNAANGGQRLHYSALVGFNADETDDNKAADDNTAVEYNKALHTFNSQKGDGGFNSKRFGDARINTQTTNRINSQIIEWATAGGKANQSANDKNKDEETNAKTNAKDKAQIKAQMKREAESGLTAIA